MIRFSLLGSGSRGNAALVVSHEASILVDNGLSLKRLQAALLDFGAPLEDLDAVFVTHEHGDHVNGIGPLSRRYGVPVYITRATHARLPQKVGKLPRVEFFEAGDRLSIGDLDVSSFSVSHDAADPVGYTVRCRGAKVGFATDLGHASHLVRTRLAGSHALVLESNYCPEMLRHGAYPPRIRQRIRGRQGHLSNQDMGSLLSSLLHEALQTVLLVHISENNNTPEKAYAMAARVLDGHRAQLFVASQDQPTPLFEVRP